ncbi:MAG: hypothetical protein KBD78_13120 [Oligoflexales bacterium]|nr:hypothetical protein [Oligoflexales bacterium]
MKKLLTLSVLAATLVSTAVFAQNTTAETTTTADSSSSNSGMRKPGMGKPDHQGGAPVLLISKKASQPTMKSFQIAQTLIDALAGQDNKAKKAVLLFDKDGNPLSAKIDVEKKVTAKTADALQEAGLGFVRLINNELGYTGLAATAGNGNTILNLTAISQMKDDDSVVTIAVVVAKDGKGIDIIKAPLNQNDADKLLKAKKAADLKDAKPSKGGKK